MFFNWFFRVVAERKMKRGETVPWIDYPRLVTQFCILCRPQHKLAELEQSFTRVKCRAMKSNRLMGGPPAERKIKNLEKLWRTSTTDGNIFPAEKPVLNQANLQGEVKGFLSIISIRTILHSLLSFFLLVSYLNKN